MLKLITLSNRRVAQAFVDYMATKSIVIQIQQQGDDVELWLENSHSIDRIEIENELRHFLQHPQDPRYLAASWQTGSVNSSIKYRSQFSLQSIIQQAGIITISVTVISVLLYLLMAIVGTNVVMYFLGFPATSHEYVEIWRWITPAFLHFSILHILFNLTWWWYLGGMIERKIGKAKLLEIFILSALISNFCQSIFSDANFGGLSGVVYALIGYVWLSGEKQPQHGLFLERSIMIFSIVWLVAGYTGFLGPIANAAHLSGLLVGLMLAFKDVIMIKPKKN